MIIEDALKENGKAKSDSLRKNSYVKVGLAGKLQWWCDKAGALSSVPFKDIIRNDWEPYYPEEIRPQRVWRIVETRNPYVFRRKNFWQFLGVH